MDQRQRCIRLGGAMILCAAVLRLFGSGLLPPVSQWLTEDIQSFLIYLETGRIVRFSASSPTLPAFAGESPAPATEPAATEWVCPVFSPEEVPSVRCSSGVEPDLEALLAQPLQWDLTAEGPRVLILHTHATESYTGEDYEALSDFRTLDEGYNMVSIGAHLAELLEEAGIGVIHDGTLHDYPSYNGSYAASRKTMQDYLSEYPDIQLVLDLHRDASGDIHNQLVTSATVGGEQAAQLMLVVGSGNGNGNHPRWEENLSLALKLQALLEREDPGVCRPLDLRSGRFNQDLLPGGLLVEVGAAGNTREEALRAVEALGQAIIALAKGS